VTGSVASEGRAASSSRIAARIISDSSSGGGGVAAAVAGASVAAALPVGPACYTPGGEAPGSRATSSAQETTGRTDVGTTPFLAAWENFYVIVGSSGAALTGLQFVVIALISESTRHRSSQEIAAFGTPTVVHFCAVLFISAAMSAPWQGLWGPAITLGCGGALGVVYAIVVVIRTRSQKGYKPVLEDWLWHIVLPFAAYATLFAAAVSMQRHPSPALFSVAAASLLLLFIGIHNAWDTVTYITVGQGQEGQ
jgi:hypothetical protein